MSEVSYLCPNCAGPLTYSIQGQNWECKFCNSSFTLETLTNKENGETAKEFSGMKAYSCPTCGGQLITSQNTAATFCTFCHNHVVIKSRLENRRSPDAILPFQITKEDAINKIKKYCKKIPLMPKTIRDQIRNEEISGLYIPCWNFIGTADFVVKGQYEKRATWTDNVFQYTKKDTYCAVRRGSIRYQGLPMDGSSRIDDAIIASLEPYDYTKLTEFSPQYLAGCFMEAYDVDARTAWDTIRPQLDADINAGAKPLTRDIPNLGGRTFEVFYPNMQTRQILMPVWVLMGKHNQNPYYIAINGQSGKLSVNLPCSPMRAAALFVSTAAVLTALFFSIGGIWI